MRKIILLASSLVLLSLNSAQADPPPQYSASDLLNTFAPAAPEANLPNTASGAACDGGPRGPGGDCLEAAEGITRQICTFDSHDSRICPGGKRPANLKPVVAIHHQASRNLLITFKNNSTELTPQARSNARQMALAMMDPRAKGEKFEIAGHTNAVGGRDHNLELSRLRAKAVVDFLVAAGADPSNLSAAGYGYDQPLPGSDPRSGENRRVEARGTD